MKSWKSTIGGAFAALGTALMGIGIVPQFYQAPNNGVPSSVFTWIMIIGFILNGIGIFFGHLYAADQQTMIDLLNRAGIDTGPVKPETPSTPPKP